MRPGVRISRSSFGDNPVAVVFRHRNLIWQTTRSDVRARFAGSVLGLVWLFLLPLLLLSCYAAVYIFIFEVRFAQLNSNEYVALIFCGLIPFLGFADAIGTGVPSVTSNSSLIKNTLFPIELIPVKSVLVSQCTQVAGTFLLVIALAIMNKLGAWSFLLPVIWISQILFTIGLVWILSSLNVYFRDLQNVVSVLILFLMMVSPIAYTPDMVPEGLRPLLTINPLYYFITAYQDCLMRNRLPQDGVLFFALILAVLFFFGGFWFFARMKRVFADNV